MTVPNAPPPSAAMLQILAGRWMSAAASVAAKLGVADELSAGPRSAEDVARSVGAHPDALHRILRGLASIGVFAEDDQGRFTNTALSETLRTGPETLRAMAVMNAEKPISSAWNELLHAVKTGGPAFDKVNGAGLFEYFERDEGFARVFADAMTSRSAMEAKAVTAALDCSGVGTLVDVGGGQGLLLASVLAKNPALRGVLFDMPAVVANAKPILARAGVESRCDVASGDFFASVPSADGYMLKHILHDWDDARCVKILKSIHAAAKPGARLFVIESVIEPGNAPHFGKILDLQMLVVTGGRERTRAEWEKLFEAGGFTLTRIVATPAPLSIVEGTRVS